MMPRIQASKLQDGSHKYCPGNGMLEDIAVAVTVFTYRTECCLYFEASYASPIQTDNNSYGDAERSPDREQRNAVGNVPPPPSCLFILKLHNACDESLVVLGRAESLRPYPNPPGKATSWPVHDPSPESVIIVVYKPPAAAAAATNQMSHRLPSQIKAVDDASHHPGVSHDPTRRDETSVLYCLAAINVNNYDVPQYTNCGTDSQRLYLRALVVVPTASDAKKRTERESGLPTTPPPPPPPPSTL
ncbi:hypothetical protein AXG93_3943s1400 [Marchantia polymorpha subsp. ruderalis]|uniref:Uncharacterized protein n=1 Tax=Marchantia polymorpha subsp. ruderalis TaxID=1480154 RepID=A0A176WCV8_MARPO|nr:hypothetical protein AXG93_3943s1400 [Marchantia polymorpha subsp. ruderalis]